MAIVFKTPKSTLNTTSKQIQNVDGNCPPCPEPVLEGKELNYTQNGEYTVTPEQGVDGFSSIDVTVNVPSDVNNQDKTVSPSTSSQSVSADSGYSGLGTVTVNPVTSSIDANIQPENILSGVTILGVSGTDEGYDAGYTDGETAGHSAGYAEGEADGIVEGIAEQKAKLASATFTANDTYTREDGWNSITVNVPETPLSAGQTKVASLGIKSYTPQAGGFSSFTVTTDAGFDCDIKGADRCPFRSVSEITALEESGVNFLNMYNIQNSVWVELPAFDSSASSYFDEYDSCIIEFDSTNQYWPNHKFKIQSSRESAGHPEWQSVWPIDFDWRNIKMLNVSRRSVSEGVTTYEYCWVAKYNTLACHSNGSVSIPNDLRYGTVTVNVPSDINNQNKTVNPSTSSQSISADSGYSGLGTVTVNAVTSSIDQNIAAGNIKNGVSILGVTGSYDPQPNLQSKSVNPTTSAQTVSPDSGYDGLSQVSVAAVTAAIDPNIQAENILSGVNILGVDGTNDGYDTGYNAGVADGYQSGYSEGHSDGYTEGYSGGYDEGEADGVRAQKAKLTSTTLTSNGNYTREDGWNSVTVAVPSSINNQNKTINPSTSQQNVTADSGYSGLGMVTVNAVTAEISPNIVPENILDGVTILGVTGTDLGYNAGYSEGYSDGQESCQGGCENTVLLDEYITENGTYSYAPSDYQGESYDAFNGANIIVDVPEPLLQDKTVTPTTSQQTINADAGYDGLDTVTVNAVTSAIDQNIVAGNIRSGVTILGVLGTYSGGTPVQGDKFWMKSLEDGNQITINYVTPSTYSTHPYNIEYSLDGTTWTTATFTRNNPATINVNTNDVVYFRGDNASLYTAYSNIGGVRFGSSKTVDIGGYVCSLLDPNNYVDYTLIADYAFNSIFYSANGVSSIQIVDASQLVLPNTTTVRCYESMFGNCSTLEVAPALPATNVASEAYKAMFKNCSSLRAVPAMSFKTVDVNSCNNMFQGCTSLTSIPVINIYGLANGCFAYMFDGCIGITSIPAGSVYGANGQIAPAESCMQMFGGCTALQTVPQNLLPCKTVYTQCYDSMFKGCTNLLNAPALPGNVSGNGSGSTRCYQSMFQDCSSLTTAPDLPSTNTYNYCYSLMFYNCASLTTAPVLPATSVAGYAYQSMFAGCSSLNEITCLATSLSTNATSNWVNGVAATGTFYKNANMSNWTTGNAGIPTNWTVEDYVSA